MISPRLDSTGTLNVGLEKKHSANDEAFFKAIGYTTTRVPSAYVSAVSRDPKTGEARGMASGGA
jgi:hypothetical protein